MRAFVSLSLLGSLAVSSSALVFVRKIDWQHLSIDLFFAVVSLVGYQSLLGLGHFRDQGLLFFHNGWRIDISHLGLPVQVLGFVGFMLVASHTNYWVHRVFHTQPFLWRLHKFHHSQTSFTGLSNYRAHPAEIVLSGYFNAFALALLFPFTNEYAKFYGYFIFVMGIFTHSNLRTNLGFLEKVLVSPIAHKVHHSLNPRHLDKNFGFAFSFWDVLYGTYQHVEVADSLEIGLAEYRDLTPFGAAARSLSEPLLGVEREHRPA